MAKGFKAGAGGASILSFKVVGATAAPENIKETTIWVETEAAVTSWDLAPKEPVRRSANRNRNVYPYVSDSFTTSGITFTENADGTVTANGTATGNAYFKCSDADHYMELEAGTYTLSGDPTTGNTKIEVGVSYDDFETVTWYTTTGVQARSFTLDRAAKARMVLTVVSGKTLSNAVFKPQLEKGSAATSFVKGDATGQVWIQTADSGPVAFNALKKNGIRVCPVSVYQYVSGAWELKTAKVYTGSAWEELLDLEPYFFRTGVGWVSDHAVELFDGCTMDTEAIHILESIVGPRNGFITEEPISLPGATTLHLLLKSEGSGSDASNGFYIGFGSETTDWPEQYWTAYLLVQDAAADWTEYTLDISGGITNQYFKAFGYYCNAVTLGDIWYT